MSIDRVLLIAVMCVAFAFSITGQDQPSASDVTITVTHGKDGSIQVQDQDGRGIMFYRGDVEVQDYLASPIPSEEWEARLKVALAETYKSDPSLKAKTETYNYYKTEAIKR